MPKILHAEFLAKDIKLFRIEAPKISKKRQAGQFVIVRVHDKGERIPLTIADSDPVEGSVTIIVQGIGKTTKLLNRFNTGDEVMDIVGPLGKPSEIEKFGKACVIGGGVGTAIAFPTAKALKQADNHVISIIGAKNKDLVILEKEMQEFCDETYVTTDDGSYGYHGFVTGKLKELIDSGNKPDFVLAIGPIMMMKSVADITREYGIKTMVSLNPVMVDGTGMCGGCRVNIGDSVQFVCVDGPEFDAHQVDFQSLLNRNTAYANQEKASLESIGHDHGEDGCRLDAAVKELE